MADDKQSTEPSTPTVTKTATEDGSDSGKAKKPRWPKTKNNNKSTTSSFTMMQKKSISKFKGATEDIKEHTFTYDPQMNRRWMISRKEFIEYAGRKYGPNATTSIKKGVKP